MTFTDFALEKMMDLYNNHNDEVGSQIKAQHPDKKPTDCITYVINVLKHAFEKDGRKPVAQKVAQLGKKGTELAAYLVNEQKWTGIYYNPDVNHPRDGDLNHTFSRKVALESKKYYTIPLSYWLINYRPTPETDPKYQSFSGVGGSKEPTKLDQTQLQMFQKVKFAYGVSKGGKHVWLYSLGTIYDVHWDKIGADLYKATKFEDFEWLSGALVAPPDALAAARLDQRVLP
ncbi:MAG TPA: hypothetical protein VIS96_01015 [Terrimicrobiaceae bacterium]